MRKARHDGRGTAECEGHSGRKGHSGMQRTWATRVQSNTQTPLVPQRQDASSPVLRTAVAGNASGLHYAVHRHDAKRQTRSADHMPVAVPNKTGNKNIHVTICFFSQCVAFLPFHTIWRTDNHFLLSVFICFFTVLCKQESIIALKRLHGRPLEGHMTTCQLMTPHCQPHKRENFILRLLCKHDFQPIP